MTVAAVNNGAPASGEQTAGTVNLHPQAGDDWKSWPDDKAVRTQLQLNPPQLSMYLRRGYIVRYKCPDNVLRFHPGEVEMLHRRLEQGTIAEVSDLRESNTELKDVLRHMNLALKQQNEHIEKLFTMITAPFEKGTEFLCNILGETTKRVNVLEGNFDQSIMAREQLLSLEHERTLKTQRAQAFNENLRHGMDKLGEAIGPFTQTVLANMGFPGTKKHPGLELLESIDPAMVELLWSTDMLSDFQKGKVREIWPDRRWPGDPVPAPPAAAEAATTPPPAPAEPSAPAPAEPDKPPAAPPPEHEPPSTQRPPRRRRRRANQGEQET